ncbi:MAG: trypsin-like peptidase domain-containing protein [Salinibacterium sp.]|nr:trypsin-like peptidase domain-containing protein [Salinibacterium sp.]
MNAGMALEGASIMTDAPQDPTTGSLDSSHSLAPAAVTEPAPEQVHTGASFVKRTPVVMGLVAALAVGALVGGVSGAGVTLWATSSNTSGTAVVGTANPTTITVNDTTSATQVTAVAARSMPSVVTIGVLSANAGGTGSGVVLSKDGFILTNTHVVTLDGQISNPKITVTTSDGRLFTATIVGTDPISDLAVIKVDGVTDLQPATFADSSNLNVGDTAIAIGAPLGLAGTVTDGIVSALNRSITIASSAVPPDTSTQDTTPNQGSDPFFNFDMPGQNTQGAASSATISLSVIQTDAAINPGNSGGALLDSDGNVIGINVAIASASSTSSGSQSGSIGVGFAIPSNLAQRIAQEIRQTGTATHGLLGASVTDVTEDTNQKNPTVVGASIVELTSGGAADQAGLKVGDIVTKFNGLPVTGKTDLTAQVRAVAAGSKATVTYVRDGSAGQVDVTLGELK